MRTTFCRSGLQAVAQGETKSPVWLARSVNKAKKMVTCETVVASDNCRIATTLAKKMAMNLLNHPSTFRIISIPTDLIAIPNARFCLSIKEMAIIIYCAKTSATASVLVAVLLGLFKEHQVNSGDPFYEKISSGDAAHLGDRVFVCRYRECCGRDKQSANEQKLRR